MIAEAGESITEAWLNGTARLLEVGGDAFTSILHVQRPGHFSAAESAARAHLDAALRRAGHFDTEAVANTLFPVALASGRSEEDLYKHYLERTYPVLRRLPSNRRGTYFHRMIEHTGLSVAGLPQASNPLKEVIAKMRRELLGRGPLRAAYEIAIYRPALDARVRMGFPCLSHISLKLDPLARQLHLTALYRNQFYFQRAYGNLLGLARLQTFVSSALDLTPGELVCHATHAHLDLAPRAVQALLARMKHHLTP